MYILVKVLKRQH